MYKKKSKIRKYFLSFTNKLMLLYLILVLLSDVIIGVYSYTTLTNSRSAYIKEDLTKVIQQTRDNVNTQISDVQRISNQLFDDYSIQSLLKSKEDSYSIYDLTRLYLMPVLKSNANLSLNPISINIYAQNDNITESYSPSDGPLANDRNYNIYKTTRIYSKPWYLNIIKENEDNVWRQVENDVKNNNISLLRKFISYDNFEQIGYIRMIVRMEDLFKSINS